MKQWVVQGDAGAGWPEAVRAILPTNVGA